MQFTSPRHCGAHSTRRSTSLAASCGRLLAHCTLIVALTIACGPESARDGSALQAAQQVKAAGPEADSRSGAPVDSVAAGLYETARFTRISGDRCIDMLLAADGRIYLCGFVHTAEADDQILLVCYDDAGREVWRRELGGAETDRGGLLAQTPDGRLFYSARLTGAQTIDGIDIPSPADGVFFFEFDAQGRATDVVQLDIDHVSDIAHRGEVIIAAGAEMTKGRPTTVLAGFRTDGREKWRSPLGSASRICDMYAAPDGGIYQTGAFHENVSIGDETHSSEGVFDSDAFVAKYSDGRAEWFSRFGSKGNSRPGYRSGDIALSSLLLTGHARGGMQIAGFRIDPLDDRHVLHLLSLPTDFSRLR